MPNHLTNYSVHSFGAGGAVEDKYDTTLLEYSNLKNQQLNKNLTKLQQKFNDYLIKRRVTLMFTGLLGLAAFSFAIPSVVNKKPSNMWNISCWI